MGQIIKQIISLFQQDQGQEYLSARPEGISNAVLAALIGGGALVSILLVNKFVK